MKKFTSLFILFIVTITIKAQEVENKKAIPYYEVPNYDEIAFTAGSVAARTVDALGFRFRWSTEDLTENNLNFRPNEESRSIKETVEHILDLSRTILSSTLAEKVTYANKSELSYNEKRLEVLENLKKTSEILIKSTEADLATYKMGSKTSGLPFWYQINGPIADAIWHAGQIASFRRSSGNPISKKINFLRGTIKD